MAELQNWGPWPGTIIKRENDPENDPSTKFSAGDLCGRVKVDIPGLISESAWALPMGWGGAPLFGINMVPPINADVMVFFPLGRIDQPRWISAHHGPDEVFPEFTHPDMIVAGTDRFRVVIDQRTNYAAIRVIENIDGVEVVQCEDLWNIAERGRRIYAKTALEAETGGQMNIKATGDVDIKGRKVLPHGRPIS